MRIRLLTLIAGSSLLGPVGSAVAADPGYPTVVELFTAQGCAACPAADAALARLSGRADLLLLSFSVTYWDRFGWRDPLAQAEFTERQHAYARVGRREAATPQFVINGRFGTPYRGDAELARAIASADRGEAGPAIVARGRTMMVMGDRRSAREAVVWLVRFDPGPIRTPVRAGQNGGRTLEHRNVVRALTRLGAWRGEAVALRLPPRQGGLRRAVLVQSATGGAIVAAALLD